LPLRGQLDPAWLSYARGIVEHEGQPYLLVSLSGFIEAGVLAQAA
jgi:purine-binding chemotaxis protein CheW